MKNKDKTLEEYYKQIKLAEKYNKIREEYNKIIERNTKMERDLRDYYTDLEIECLEQTLMKKWSK